MPAALQNIGEAGQIGVDISMRILQRVAYAGLSGEVNHHRKTIPLEQRLDGRSIGKIQFFEMKSRIVAENIEPSRF